MSKKCFLYLFFCLLGLQANAQINVSGKVIDKKTDEALLGVNVVVAGTTIGSVTDMDGNFTISVPTENTQLKFSYVGYREELVSVGKQKSLTVLLVGDSEELDEVVVIGYGTVKKRDLTGSVSQLKAKEINAFPVSNPIQALQGRTPGVVITSNNGNPKGDFSIRIRGTNSIRGDNTPLYIIDGVPSSPSSVNGAEIESIEVLKDASATAIYGSRGANGVILITTKRGKAGATSVTYQGSYGIQSQIRRLDLMNSTQWAQLYNEQQTNDTGKSFYTEEQMAQLGKTNTDWQKLVFADAPVQDHNVTLVGGNEKTKIMVSGSMLLKDGLIPNSYYNKYNLRSNIEHKINDKITLNLSMIRTHTQSSDKNSGGGNRGGTLIGAAFAAPPSIAPYKEDGSYADLRSFTPFMSNAIYNPMNMIHESKSITKANLSNLNGSISYSPIKGLTLKSTFGYETNDYRTDNYTSSKMQYAMSSASVGTTQYSDIISENIVNYNTSFGKDHKLDVLGGFTYESMTNTATSMSGTNFVSDVPETHQISAAATFGTPSTSYTQWCLMSYLARANYSFKGRYMATISFRADGSSRYSDGSKWGYFPSGALAWRISDEAFMENVKSISDLKLRMGYGETGSTAISPYTTLNMLNQGKVVLGSGLVNYYSPGSNLPANLKWETTSQFNVGVDFGMFNQRLRLTADYYEKNTRDLLNAVSLPASIGYSTTVQNIGKMRNRGVEFMIDGDIFRTKDFDWSVSYNMAFNRNTVTELYNGEDIWGGIVDLSYVADPVNLIREGEPLGIFYAYKTDGYTETGNLKYVDTTGEGILNADDKVKIGDPNADFTYGLNSDMRYKDFEFSFFFQGSQGNDIYNVGETANLDYGMGLNLRKDVYFSHWKSTNTPEQNAAAKYPRIQKSIDFKHCDRYVEDGSYLRLKNIMIGYNLPVSKWRCKSWIKGVKVFVSAQNLFTITNYSGIDPEVNSWGGGNSVNLGLDYLTYPNSKTITFGGKLEF